MFSELEHEFADLNFELGCLHLFSQQYEQSTEYFEKAKEVGLCHIVGICPNDFQKINVIKGLLEKNLKKTSLANDQQDIVKTVRALKPLFTTAEYSAEVSLLAETLWRAASRIPDTDSDPELVNEVIQLLEKSIECDETQSLFTKIFSIEMIPLELELLFQVRTF